MSYFRRRDWRREQAKLCCGCFYFDSRTRKCALDPDIDPLELKEDEKLEEFSIMCSKRKPWYGCSNCRYGLERACVSTCLKQIVINWKGIPQTTDEKASVCA